MVRVPQLRAGDLRLGANLSRSWCDLAGISCFGSVGLRALAVRFVGEFWNVAGFGAGLVIRFALFAPLSPFRYSY